MEASCWTRLGGAEVHRAGDSIGPWEGHDGFFSSELSCMKKQSWVSAQWHLTTILTLQHNHISEYHEPMKHRSNFSRTKVLPSNDILLGCNPTR